MPERIYKTKENLVVEIPLSQDASDYFGEKVGEVPNIIGVICNDEYGNEEMGFHQLIDMTYKGKEPQVDGLLISYSGSKKDFIKLCEDLEISVHEYPICAYCKKTIYGCFTIGDKGNMCSDCEQKYE